MKQTETTEKKKHLTDAELRQVTGGGTLGDDWESEKQRCQELSDQVKCENQPCCKWEEDGKDSHCYYWESNYS